MSYAQQLANLLQTEVVAPNSLVWYSGSNEPYPADRLIPSATLRSLLHIDPSSSIFKRYFVTFYPEKAK